jgi:two-component system sensor histidine kinase UhpB
LVAESPTQSPVCSKQGAWPWREVVGVIALAILFTALAAHYDLSERLYALTRRWEFLQVDEWPVGLSVLALGLIWLCWQRIVHARRELIARQRAETQLEGVLKANRKLTQEHLRLQESERKHLARELHDHLGQYLNAIKLDAVSICDSDLSESESVGKAATQIVHSVDNVHAAVSDMIRRLRPVGLDELGLVAAIEHCIDHWQARLPQTRFTLSVEGDFGALSESLALTVYRLVQEGLTNVYKHARARRVQIVLAQRTPDEVLLRVSDDGCGMLPEAPTSRFGLSGMRERVEIGGGVFELRSAPGRGVSFEARMPVGSDAG